MRVDYHFHPNFPLLSWRETRGKARRIWKAFAKNKLDGVIITEHVFKRPRTAFETLQRFRPADARTHIIPGLEYLTKEGLDVIIFAENAYQIYDRAELLQPGALGIEALADLVKKSPHLYAVVPHPCSPGYNWVEKLGRQKALDLIEQFELLEVHNGAFELPRRILRWSGLHRVFRKKYREVLHTLSVPQSLREKARLEVVGSDAHHGFEMGACTEIPGVRATNYQEFFRAVTTRQGKQIKGYKYRRWPLLPRSVWTIITESFLRRSGFYLQDSSLQEPSTDFLDEVFPDVGLEEDVLTARPKKL